MSRGHTLLELVAVLLLLAIGAGVALPRLRDVRDHLAVVAAREALAGLFAEARVAAVGHGGATLNLVADPPRGWSQVGDSILRSVDFRGDLAVQMLLPRGRTVSQIRFDALGLGQVASQTIRFRRGQAEGALVVSGYGRVRRR